MDTDVSNPALVAREVVQEILNPEELNEVRHLTRHAVLNFINVQIPQVLNSINAVRYISFAFNLKPYHLLYNLT